MCHTNLIRLAGLGVASLLLCSTAVAAKTIVYCSEGSPENFTPALNITGTSLDAARPVYDQLLEFERGSTTVAPGLAESAATCGSRSSRSTEGSSRRESFTGWACRSGGLAAWYCPRVGR